MSDQTEDVGLLTPQDEPPKEEDTHNGPQFRVRLLDELSCEDVKKCTRGSSVSKYNSQYHKLFHNIPKEENVMKELSSSSCPRVIWRSVCVAWNSSSRSSAVKQRCPCRRGETFLLLILCSYTIHSEAQNKPINTVQHCGYSSRSNVSS
ncbi:GRAM domain-containing protein 2A isoform X1 [Tachysurus ichikawai]